MKITGIKNIITLCLVICSSVALASMKHYPYSKTGHDEFSELIFYKDDIVLLKDISDEKVNEYYKKTKWKFFGWSTYYLYEYVDCEYVSSVIFSRSNKTSMSYKFDYSIQEIQYKETSITIKGSISVKESMKLKKLDLVGNEEFSLSGTSEQYLRHQENSSLTITVNPGKKMTLHVTGNAKLSTCFARYYFFGICMGKGAFESIDVIDSFYELLEENV